MSLAQAAGDGVVVHSFVLCEACQRRGQAQVQEQQPEAEIHRGHLEDATPVRDLLSLQFCLSNFTSLD